MNKKLQIAILSILFILLTQNIFFDIYRGAIFNVMPHDDYAPYLLAIIGEEGGVIAEAPYTYRILSVIPAVPFYYILPVYKFTNAANTNVNYIRAIQALSMVSYLSMLVLSFLIYKISKIKFKADNLTALLSVFLTFLFIRHTGIYSADAIAIMFIALIIYYIQNKLLFSILMFSSVILNEKIAIIFTVLVLSRWIFRQEKLNYHTFIPVLSLILYFFIRYIFPYHGNENHLVPGSYMDNIVTNLIYTFSLKGLILNIVPTLLCLALCIFAFNESRISDNIDKLYFTKIDFIVIIALFVISHLINVDYNVGRIVMYSFPFFLPLAMKFIATNIPKIF